VTRLANVVHALGHIRWRDQTSRTRAIVGGLER
jgi:hypothetical protein